MSSTPPNGGYKWALGVLVVLVVMLLAIRCVEVMGGHTPTLLLDGLTTTSVAALIAAAGYTGHQR